MADPFPTASLTAASWWVASPDALRPPWVAHPSRAPAILSDQRDVAAIRATRPASSSTCDGALHLTTIPLASRSRHTTAAVSAGAGSATRVKRGALGAWVRNRLRVVAAGQAPSATSHLRT